MHRRFSLLAASLGFALAGCTDSAAPTAAEPILLKDVIVSSLPSPYYHFDYDTTGRMSGVSFASGLTAYQAVYDNDRIIELTGGSASSQNHIQYTYDPQGRVALVRYVDGTGRTFGVIELWYAGPQLTKLERSVAVTGGYIIDKTMTFAYYGDGNVNTVTTHRPAIDGVQTDNTTVLHFEQYDRGINVDGFGLIHDDFFDQLVLLPRVVLQKNNPGRETLSGSSTDYTADYTYSYDDRGRPLAKSGSLTVTGGSDAGGVFALRTDYSYYR